MKLDIIRAWWGGALNPEVAFNGWVGAVLGAIASAIVAVIVVRLTQRNDESILMKQASAQRGEAFDQRRREAFAGVLAALDAYELGRV